MTALYEGRHRVLEQDQCGCVHDGCGRRGWDPRCPVHGIDARVAAGIWDARMRDLWNQARAEAAR